MVQLSLEGTGRVIGLLEASVMAREIASRLICTQRAIKRLAECFVTQTQRLIIRGQESQSRGGVSWHASQVDAMYLLLSDSTVVAGYSKFTCCVPVPIRL